MNRVRWIGKAVQWLGIRAIHVFTRKYFVNLRNYAGVGMHTAEAGNDYIIDKLVKGEPFAVGRCGYTEFGIMACIQNERYFKSKIHYYWRPSYINGINMPVDGSISKGLHIFDKKMRDAIENVDSIACFTDLVMCDAVLETEPSIRDKFLFETSAIYPFIECDNPWTLYLEGKKVLIVCPFADLIEKQYNNRCKIWPNGQIPEFELMTDPALFYNWYGYDEVYEDWCSAYDILRDRVLSYDFDVALLGCGRFGFILASDIKKSGKSAIHMGGAVQLLFGIKGKRWDYMGIYNEYWTRPGEETKPKYAEMMDKSSYW